ncbi:MAG: Rrf2 family transcriptional regulator [Eggerthellaceae bacterium]
MSRYLETRRRKHGGESVVIRRLFCQLKDAGIIMVEPGVGGASVVKNYDEVTLLDVFRAVESTESNLFAFHDSPNSDCPIGGAIHEILDGELEAAQRALENRLRQTTLQDLLGRLPSSARADGFI